MTPHNQPHRDITDDELDRLLDDWQHQTTDVSQLDQLRHRIISTLANSDIDSAPTNATRKSESRSRRFWWFTGGAIATAIVVLIFLDTTPHNGPKNPAPNPELPPDYTWLRDEQLQNKAHLLSAMEDTFGGQLNWIAETGGEVSLGLAESGALNAVDVQEKPRIAVRIVIEHRSPQTESWEVVWAVDVLTRDEEVVQTDVDAGELTLWTYQLPDGAIAVDSEITLTGNEPIHVYSTGVQDNRQPVQLRPGGDQQNNHPHSEYRAFQTVAVLDEEIT